VTLSEIARHAGVDVSTVSRALNSRYGVRQQVRERVLEVARQLDYRPNLLARGLITGRSQTLGLLISDIRNPFFTEVARGAEDAANAAGYDLVLCNSDLDPAKHMQYFRSLMAKHVDGVIMNSLSFLVRDDVRQIAESGVPVVLLNRPPAHNPFSTVLSDNTRGGALAAEHLLRLGHRRTAVLAGPRWQANLADRSAGFVRAMQAARGAAPPVLLRGVYTASGGYAMMRDLIARRDGITAVFATSDAIAFGSIRAALEAGLRIPNDLSLVGFDDVELAAIVHPPLTTVRQLKYELGVAAAEILIRQAGVRDALPEHRTFGVELVERASCRAIRPS
jgi:DNA-binding LacI/PurR family transcriptional regulator